jgi:plasmid stabilization system protein ParE
MSSYNLTRLAKSDVFQIWPYIARDSVGAADRVEQAIYDACASLAGDPLLGHARQDFTDRTLRFRTLVRSRVEEASISALTQESRLEADLPAGSRPHRLPTQ